MFFKDAKVDLLSSVFSSDPSRTVTDTKLSVSHAFTFHAAYKYASADAVGISFHYLFD